MRLPHTRSHWVRPPGPIAPGLKIGLLGGSFNPAHEGHVHISEVAMKRLGLDYVWWLVTPFNPLKSTVGLADLQDRVVEAKELAHHPRIIVMDIERALGTHYTVDTLTALRRRFPTTHFVWLMGSDNLATFRRWRRWNEIVARVPIAIVTRPGSILSMLHAKAVQRYGLSRRHDRSIATSSPPAIAVVDGPRNAQSSTAIRAAAEVDEAMVRAIPTC